MTRSTPTDPRRGHSFTARFGATILRGGIAPVPTTLYFYQGELGLSAQEVWFVSYILAHKWDEDLPYPSLAKMAERSGMSRRNLLRIKDGLVGKGLLVLVPRFNAVGGQESNAYDFTALFEQLEGFIRRDGPCGAGQDLTGRGGEGGVTPASPHAAAEGDGVTRASLPGVTEKSHPRVTRASPNKEADNEEADQEESPQYNLFTHIPPRVPVADSAPLVGDSGKQLDRSSSLFVAKDIKGYVHESETSNPTTEISRAGDPPNPNADAATTPLIWQAVQVRLHLSLRAEDFNGVVRYASLLTYDPATGLAVVGLPNAHLCQQVTTRLAGLIAAAISQTTGQTVQVRAVVPSVDRAAVGMHAPITPPRRAFIARPSSGRRTLPGRSSQ